MRHRIDGPWSDLHQRFQDEPAGPESRMGKTEPLRLNDPITEQQQVEIQGALAPPYGSDPAEPGFDRLQDLE